jgi:hypothetical protein
VRDLIWCIQRLAADLLKLSEETELDILNYSMEVMVQRYHTELLPVAVQLTARLVREKGILKRTPVDRSCLQCESYLRLARENVAQEEAEMNRTEMELGDLDGDEDKTYAAMGVAKTLSTVRGPSPVTLVHLDT